MAHSPANVLKAALAISIGVMLLLGGMADMVRPPADRAQVVVAEPLVKAEARLPKGVRLTEAWRLTSPYQGFGGWSAVALTGPRRFLMVSDTGLTAAFTLDMQGRASQVHLGPLGGGGIRGKRVTDYESLVLSPDSRTAWIGAEFANAILRTDGDHKSRPSIAFPPLMRHWYSNSGAETLVRLADGRFIAIAENTGDKNKGREAVMFAGDPVRHPHGYRFYYDPGDKGHPTDAALLPDGRLLILHRRIRWNGFVSTLAVADMRGVRPGMVVRSREILRFEPPGIHENFEGIAIDKGESPDQRVGVWLVADDNLMKFQRSLLIRLELDAALLAGVPAAKSGQ